MHPQPQQVILEFLGIADVDLATEECNLTEPLVTTVLHMSTLFPNVSRAVRLGKGPDRLAVEITYKDGTTRRYRTVAELVARWNEVGLVVPSAFIEQYVPCALQQPPTLQEDEETLFIPRSFAVPFAAAARRNPAVDSVFVTGWERNHHGLIVFRADDGSRHEYHTMDEVMLDIGAGQYQVVSDRMGRC